MKHGNRWIAFLLIAVLVVAGCAIPTQPVRAATKPKKLSVSLKTASPGGKKLLYVGGPKGYNKLTITAKLTPKKASGKVTYRSTNKKVATVSAKGVVTAKKAGKTTIRVTSKANGKLAKSVSVTVKKFVYAKSMKLKAETTKLDYGKTMSLTAKLTPSNATISKINYTSSDKSLATVDSDGFLVANSNGKNGTVTITATAMAKAKTPVKTKKNKTVTAAIKLQIGNLVGRGTESYRRGSSHDPSVVLAYVSDSVTNITASTVTSPEMTDTYRKKVYFIFGSHRAWLYSFDLLNWSPFANNLSTNYASVFASEASWSAKGNAGYNVTGNLWAPDVIYNKKMGKWCMYMSINGNKWNSSICLLTADQLGGNWTREGTVVYSGFTASGDHSYTATDYATVTGDTTLPNRYQSNATTWNFRYGAHAIDPCVYYDQDGILRMTYGSWSGGIYTFRLDEATGLRDTSVKYELSATSDPYMGKRIAGGNHASGEASYVQYIGEYYYLFLSYGGLESTGGYNIRVFRSKNPEGPFTDVSGEDALDGGAISGFIGTRLMTYYSFGSMVHPQIAQGHNSAFVDPQTGQSFVVYHTRFIGNGGAETHQVRVHQLFTTESGYLVAAPFEYTAYDSQSASGYTSAEVAGTYGVLFHDSTYYKDREIEQEKSLTLHADGTVSGAESGTWSLTDGKPYIRMTLSA